jgi:hypothetical protein
LLPEHCSQLLTLSFGFDLDVWDREGVGYSLGVDKMAMFLITKLMVSFRPRDEAYYLDESESDSIIFFEVILAFGSAIG